MNVSATTQHVNLHIFLRKHRYDPRPQMSKQMPRVVLKWVRRCCLSIVTLWHAYPLSRLSAHHLLTDSRRKLSIKGISSYLITDLYFNREPVNITKINKCNKNTEQHFYNEDKNTNKYTHRLRYIWRTLLRLANTKNWTTKYQIINTQPMKTKAHL